MVEDEWFDVVDANDVVIGEATRAVVHATGLRHRAVHVLVFRPDGRLYVQQRAFTKDNSPGLWDTSAAGHLERGEDYLAAALRELEEELGVGPDDGLLPLFKLDACEATGQEFVWVYRAEVSGALRPDPAEIIDGRWCSAAELNRWMAEAPEDFTPSFHLIWNRLDPGLP